MQKKTAALILATMLGFSVFWGNSAACAQNVSNDELIKSAEAATRGQATEKQKAILFANNDRLNSLAMAGKLSDADYQYNQRAFVAQNDELIRQASAKHGLTVAPPKDTSVYRAGIDTDRQLQNNKGDLTVDQVKNVRGSYNREVSEYLKSSGVSVSGEENWASKLTTDIMPSPRTMKPADFKAANSFINSSGGLAYTSAAAARIQLDLDGNQLQTPSLYEAAEYHREMQQKIKKMNAELTRLNGERAACSDADRQEAIEIEMRKRTAWMSKYVDRDNTIADLISKGNSDDSLLETNYSRTTSSRIKQAQNRNADPTTLNAEAHVSAVNEHLAVKATRRFNDAIAGAAAAGDNSAAAGSIIAANLKSLSPAQQSQAIADLEAKYGRELTKAIAGELKAKTPRPAAGGNGANVTISRSLGLANTVLNIGNQYSQGKSTGEIIWNMSIGATLENVNAETADYTSREIERLKNEYRAAGEDPDSLPVKLKIMTAATVKGTFYGSAIGSYDLLKSASHTAAGAAVAAADSAIFLVGEALDTGNVLDTAFAEIKAQNMEQSVQAARAARFGKDSLKELKRLANEAAHLRSILEQNARSARLFCRGCENSLSDLQQELRELKNLDGADVLKTLSQTQLALEKSLKDSLNALQILNQQGEAAFRALVANADKKEAQLAIQVLAAGASRQAAVLAECQKEMYKIGGLASLGQTAAIIADFELRRQRLIEQSRQASTHAAVMRNNETLFKKTVAKFDGLKERVLGAEAFFAGLRETHEGDWMVIMSGIRDIARPESKIPDDFFAEVGTLERLPDSISQQASRLQSVPGGVQTDPTDAEKLVDSALELLTPVFYSATASLASLEEIIGNLRNAVNKATRPAQSGTVTINCPSSASVNDRVSMSVALPAGNSGGGSSSAAKVDPFAGHDPNSVEGQQALYQYIHSRQSAQNTPAAGGNASSEFLVSWDFGDGEVIQKSSSAAVAHAFQFAGRYTVSVTVFSAADQGQILAKGTAQILIQTVKKAENETQTQTVKPTPGSKRLPCGHMPGECPTEGIQAVKCRLHSGSISNR